MIHLIKNLILFLWIRLKKKKKINLLLSKIIEANILDKDGIVIIHRHKKENDELPQNFKIIEEKNYGISRVIFGKFN